MPFSSREKGQGLVEYILIVALIIIVVAAAYMILKPSIDELLNTINTRINGL